MQVSFEDGIGHVGRIGRELHFVVGGDVHFDLQQAVFHFLRRHDGLRHGVTAGFRVAGDIGGEGGKLGSLHAPVGVPIKDGGEAAFPVGQGKARKDDLPHVEGGRFGGARIAGAEAGLGGDGLFAGAVVRIGGDRFFIEGGNGRLGHGGASRRGQRQQQTYGFFHRIALQLFFSG